MALPLSIQLLEKGKEKLRDIKTGAFSLASEIGTQFKAADKLLAEKLGMDTGELANREKRFQETKFTFGQKIAQSIFDIKESARQAKEKIILENSLVMKEPTPGKPLFGRPESPEEKAQVIARVEQVERIALGLAVGRLKSVKVVSEAYKYVVQHFGKEIASKMASKNPGMIESLFKIKDLQLTAIGKKNLIQGAKKGAEKLIAKSKETAQYFGIEKLGLTSEQNKEINARLDILGLKQRLIQTFADMETAAQDLGMHPQELLKIKPTNLSAAAGVAVKNLIQGNAKFITESYKAIAANPERAAELAPKIAIASGQQDDALRLIIKSGTEAGRFVSSLRIIANNTLDPVFWLKKAQELRGSKPLTDPQKMAILDLIGKQDKQGLAIFTSLLRSSSAAEKAITLWKAGLLTSPTTHIANMGGNTTMGFLETASDIPATILDKAASILSGKRTTTISPDTILAKFKGMIKGGAEAKKYLENGFYADDILMKYDIPRQVNFDNKFLDTYTKTVFRTLGAEDIIFRKMAMSESLAKSAEVQAINEGLKGQAFKARVSELLTNPTAKMSVDAVDAAEYATFQSPNILADAINKFKFKLQGKGAVKTALYVGSEITVPFVRTPSNISARLFDYTPGGFIKGLFHLVGQKGQQTIVKDFGRAITGSTVMALGYALAKKGLMIGNLPSSKSEREMKLAEGKQSNSLFFLGKWRKLDRVSPIGNLLSLGAEIARMQEEGKRGLSLAVSSGFSGLKGLFEMSMLKGASGTIKALTQPEIYGERFAEQTISSIVPSFIGRTAKIFDPTIKNPERIIGSIIAKIPIASKAVPTRLDIWGEEVKVGGGRLSLIDPFSSTEAKDDPIIKEARKIGVNIGTPSQIISKTKLTNAEYEFYQKIQGEVLKKVLSSLIADESYRDSSRTEREKAMTSAIRKTREQINDTIFPIIMIKRFNLPHNIDPAKLRDILNEGMSNPKFKNASPEKQREIILAATKE
ncbi:MAG: hypothetical protein AAB706_02100 [Patescibacteria group bacterium]